jgi:sigma-E factor negative regulatory protein RseB
VLEQAAFSGLTFENPLSVMTLLRQKANTKGWQIEQVQRIPTTQAAEGWSIGQSLQPVPGFSLQRCYRQSDPKIIQSTAMAGMSSAYSQNRTLSDSLGKMQCVFSDGLATVSVFIEPRGAKRQSIKLQNDGLDMALGGATHLLERRIGQDGWITVVGEVPLKTLQRFAASITQVR